MRIRHAAVIAAALGFAAPVRAQPAGETIWDHAAEPHIAERKAVLEDTRRIVEQLKYADEQAGQTPLTPRARAERARIARDAGIMIRYALHREPDDLELLERAGEIADLDGRTNDAIAYYRKAIALSKPHSRGPHADLAQIYARRGQLDRAIEHYRVALETDWRNPSGDDQTVALAMVYMAAGRTGEAITLLEMADTNQMRLYRGDPVREFVLAVAYDRDGQVSKAHEVLDQIIKQNPTAPVDSLIRRGRDLGARLQVAAPLDRHYVNGLLFEVSGMLEDARTEWRMYAAGGPEARYRARALAHAAAIDKLLAERVK